MFWLLGLVACTEPSLDVAPNVDLARFQGKWFEIAHLPRVTETDCVGTTAFYSMGSADELSMVNECHVGGASGQLRSVTAMAKVPDLSVPAKLSLNFGHRFGDYWIIDVGDHYEYAVVGHPTRQYLWILSRTAVMPSEVLAGVLERAKAKKFDVAALRYTPQP